ncbi:MAG: helix-turn-helix domain-containing protein [Leucobacter sp.]
MSAIEALSASERHRVVVLLVSPVVGYDATIPSLVLGSATDSAGEPIYDVRVCAAGGASVESTHDFAITAGSDPSALARADTVVVPGTRNEAARRQGRLDPATAEALALIPPDARVVSLCTGAFVLGAAGLLDGRRAATHWQFADQFRSLYPAVQLDERALFVDEGAVLSSAGLTAGIDLCLHIVRRDAGWEAANRVSRYCVAPAWREGDQAQYIERPAVEEPGESTSDSRAWALEHLGERIGVAGMAEQAHMSVRSYTRRFREETGTSPGVWLARQRVRLAQELLETTELPVDRIAAQCGLGTGAALRKQLRAVAGTTPSAHRRQFGRNRRA